MSNLGKTILVVDDEAINRIVLQSLIQRLGIRCFVAENGTEAIEITRNETVTIAFLDLQMPSPDGYETARSIRALLKDQVRMYALTAHDPPDVVDRAREAGFDEVLRKPLELETLRSLLQV